MRDFGEFISPDVTELMRLDLGRSICFPTKLKAPDSDQTVYILNKIFCYLRVLGLQFDSSKKDVKER